MGSRWMTPAFAGALAVCCVGKPGSADSSDSAGSRDSGPTLADSGTSDSGVPESNGVTLDPNVIPPELLSDIHLLTWDGSSVSYNDGVVPYDLNMPLFSDYALKERAIWIPPGTTIGFTASGILDFPEGTIIAKSFLFPEDYRTPDANLRLIETRLMVRGSNGWNAWPYIWSEDGSDATLEVAGEVRQIQFVDAEGQRQTSNYLIPQRNQCVECHEHRSTDGERTLTLIGPQARHLHRTRTYPEGDENQLVRLDRLGMLTGLPDLDTITPAFSSASLAEAHIASMDWSTLERAARDYLDINCAHCHNPEAVEGVSSQLHLNHDNEDLFHLGVCKRPSSAGEGAEDRDYDIQPGNAEASILFFRFVTVDVGAMMPQIGRSLAHAEATDLLRRWIDDMPVATCSEADDTGR